MLFREAWLARNGYQDKTAPADSYCQQCRDNNLDDCANCDKDIKVIDGQGH